MAKPNPSQSEIEILQSLWDREKATVREIHNDVQKRRQVGYTTTLKQVQRMVDKGLIKKVSDASRAHIYRAVLKPQKTRKQLVDRLVESAFDGSSNALVLQALGQSKPTADEIAEIRALLEKYEQDD